MGGVAARTPGFTTRQRYVWGGVYASFGVIGLAIFFLGDRSIFLPIISAGWLVLASMYLIPAAVKYRRERGGRHAASQP
jgi:peptidoglycan/LPS O-acetylase OafA/YrhL